MDYVPTQIRGQFNSNENRKLPQNQPNISTRQNIEGMLASYSIPNVTSFDKISRRYKNLYTVANGQILLSSTI